MIWPLLWVLLVVMVVDDVRIAVMNDVTLQPQHHRQRIVRYSYYPSSVHRVNEISMRMNPLPLYLVDVDVKLDLDKGGGY
jgi:hypothetical protein